jgi:hypothetical protein
MLEDSLAICVLSMVAFGVFFSQLYPKLCYGSLSERLKEDDFYGHRPLNFNEKIILRGRMVVVLICEIIVFTMLAYSLVNTLPPGWELAFARSIYNNMMTS